MRSEFKLAAGVAVTDLSGISEGYSLRQIDEGYSVFTVNVSADRLENTFMSLARLVRTPGFALIEIPTRLQDEEQIRDDDRAPFHKDVYYLDGIESDRFEALFLEEPELFVGDGEITFGFGSHQGTDEVFVDRYKLTRIYADEPEKYIQALEALGYERREPLRTVWDNITPQTPGRIEIITIEGRTIYDLMETLEREEGFYFAERKES